MTKPADPIFWPAALMQKDAAAYCGLSVDLFKAICPVKPIAFTQSTHGRRYLRSRLDEWLSSLDPNAASVPVRRLGDSYNGGHSVAKRA